MPRTCISERQRSQADWLHHTLGSRQLVAHVVTVPTEGGVKDVIVKIETPRRLRPLGELGLSAHNLERIDTLVRKRAGLLLVAGPTGSGKAALMYAMLASLDRFRARDLRARVPESIQAGRRAARRDFVGRLQARRGAGVAGAGYLEMTGLQEVLVVTPALESLIARGAPEAEIAEQAMQDGMVTLAQDGLAKMVEGTIDLPQLTAALA